jgi:hypothetical protein
MCRTAVIALSPPLRAGPQNTKPLPDAKYQTELSRRRILHKLKADRRFVFFSRPGAGVPLHECPLLTKADIGCYAMTEQFRAGLVSCAFSGIKAQA